MSAWPCQQELGGREIKARWGCPVSCPSGPLVPPCAEAGQGGHLPRWPDRQAAWARGCQSALTRGGGGGGQEGRLFCAGPESSRTGRRGRGGHCFLTGSWWRGKLFVTTLLPSHLLIDKHRARSAEWKAMLPDASSPGVPSHSHCPLGRPPGPGPGDTTSPVSPSLSGERNKSKGFEHVPGLSVVARF